MKPGLLVLSAEKPLETHTESFPNSRTRVPFMHIIHVEEDESFELVHVHVCQSTLY